MVAFSFQEKKLLEEAFVTLYVQGTDAVGDMVYGYVLMRGDYMLQFLQDSRQGGVKNIGAYGKIILRGEEELSPQDRLDMQQYFGFGEHETHLSWTQAKAPHGGA